MLRWIKRLWCELTGHDFKCISDCLGSDSYPEYPWYRCRKCRHEEGL